MSLTETWSWQHEKNMHLAQSLQVMTPSPAHPLHCATVDAHCALLLRERAVHMDAASKLLLNFGIVSDGMCRLFLQTACSLILLLYGFHHAAKSPSHKSSHNPPCHTASKGICKSARREVFQAVSQ
jgi:hypothetical protein